MQRASVERAYARTVVDELYRSPDDVLTVHYALQRLRGDQPSLSAPIAAIAVRNLGTQEARVFSIKDEADRAALGTSGPLAPRQMNQLEYCLLYNFYSFLADRPAARLVHWYMRDEKYGFQALENRFRSVRADFYRLLADPAGGSKAPIGNAAASDGLPLRIPEDRKVDLAKIVDDIYGTGALSLREIADRNGLSRDEMIPGDLEPGAFGSGLHARLQRSTATKARLIAEVLQLVRDRRLVLDTSEPVAASDQIRIFINYRREDTGDVAARLNDRLGVAFGEASVFLDVEDIPVGADYRLELREQIERCDVFLVLLGQRWLTISNDRGRRRLDDPEDLVRAEITQALQRRDVRVIPVLVDGAPLPSGGELPADIDALRHRQAVRLRTSSQPDFKGDVESLVVRIRETMQRMRASAR